MNDLIAQFAQTIKSLHALAKSVHEKFQAVDELKNILAKLVEEKLQTVNDVKKTLEKVKRDVQSVRQGDLSRSSAALTTYTLVERMKMLESSGNYVASRELEKFLLQRQVNWWPVGARTNFPGPGSGETDTCEPFFSKIMELFATGEVHRRSKGYQTVEAKQAETENY